MTDRVGQQLGQYRLVRLLGRGGFAEVYLGEHVRLKTLVAIKILHTSLEDDDVGDFLREAQTVARLKHPHIVRVFDFDVEHHTPYLVMDYLPNGNIRRSYPKGAPLPLGTIVSYVEQVASALQYAHDQKLIHRDVKPENMLLDRDNAIVLSDFGIALIAQSSRHQSTQEVAGTAAYMAPEQFQGHPHRASDQYALGLVVYEWLTGDRPFRGSFSEIASQHLFVPPPPMREKMPTISSEIELVVLTSLEKDPLNRFGSVQAFATAFKQASRVVPYSTVLPPHSTVLPPPQISSTSKSIPLEKSLLPQRGISRRTIVLGLGVAGLAVAGGGLTWLLSSRTPPPAHSVWYDNNYLYKKSITIDHAKVSGGSSFIDFPVLISMTDTNLKIVDNGGYVQNANGYDIIFTDGTETIRLDHEIEKYVPDTGEIIMWVRIPTVSASADTVVYIYFGNKSISATQENKTGVWNNSYIGVWHLKETSGTQYDSTRNGNNSISVNVTTEGSAAGQIDGADSFNGSSNYIEINGLLGSPGSVTLSSWVRLTSGPSRAEVISIGDHVAISMDDYSYSGFYFDGSTWRGISSFTNSNRTGWHYVVYTIDGVAYTQTIYVDGVQKAQTTDVQAISYSGLGTNMFIGKHGSANAFYFNGSICEVRVSAGVRSAGWVATEYNNQNSSSSFYTVSSLVSK